jgi:multiple sugar transport system permease protein
MMLSKVRNLKVRDIKQLQLNKPKLKRTLRSSKYLILGRELNQGMLFKLFIYVIFISTGFIYLQPIFHMVTSMIKDARDLLDPTVIWVPRSVFLGHLQYAWEALRYPTSFTISISVALATAVFHCFSCAIAGYAFARLQFPFKRFWLACLIIAFIMPPQVIILPTILAYNQMGFANEIYALFVPALFGHGIRGALFVIIFRQFFLTQPKELEEAAKIDGASAFRTFTRVILPLSKPAILVVFLFTFVWTWNDTYFSSMFLTGAADVPLAMQMSRMDQAIQAMLESGEAPLIFFEPIMMASSFLVILPPFLLYVFAQRWFVESVERTGVVGE